MANPTTETDTETTTGSHELLGVGAETRVYCPIEDCTYGPGGECIEFEYCPYCAVSTEDMEHDSETVEGEVYCSNTLMSLYRYCPKCGEEVDE